AHQSAEDRVELAVVEAPRERRVDRGHQADVEHVRIQMNPVTVEIPLSYEIHDGCDGRFHVTASHGAQLEQPDARVLWIRRTHRRALGTIPWTDEDYVMRIDERRQTLDVADDSWCPHRRRLEVHPGHASGRRAAG